jgi:ketosteroid isomerase-like protein
MESLTPSAVAAVYPNVDTRALAAAFREYASLNEEIAIQRIDVAPDGQTASVNAVLAITQVVKIGRAAPVTRNVVFALRRQGDRWLIESIK